MSAPARTMSDSSNHSDTLRKRVGKACDRCRLKKSKCDGSSPCTRCTADNAICVFGERRKAHDKVYPKGYVEMLEQQQAQLVSGLQETYRRLLAANAWPGAPLDEHEGHPLTHDILNTLDLIQHKSDGHLDLFEEDPEKMQHRLVSQGAPLVHRRGSVSSDSEHSVTHSHSHSHKRPRSVVDSPIASPVTSSYRKSLDMERPARTSAPATSTSQQSQSHFPVKPSPLHTESQDLDQFQLDEDALMSTFDWQDTSNDTLDVADPLFTYPVSCTRPPFIFQPWQDSTNPTPNDFSMTSFPQGIPSQLSFTNMQQLQKEPFDADYSGYVPVAS